MKRFFAILIALIMIFAISSVAFADTVLIAGDWSLATEDGDVWVIGSYIGEDKDVSTITEYGGISLNTLGSHSFANNVTTECVSVLAPINEIGNYAFLNATAITSVKMTSSVNRIGVGAFSGTVSLREVNLEDTSITELSPYLFLNSGIEEITLPESCVKILHDAFSGCDGLTKIVIPASVTEIGAEAFRSSENVVICAPYGSYAIEYAKANGIKYSYSDITEVTFLRGDADGDGEITIIDATKIQRVRALFDDDPDGMIALRAKSGVEPELSIMDATRIQRKIALYNDPYGIGESVTVLIMSDGTIFNPVEET